MRVKDFGGEERFEKEELGNGRRNQLEKCVMDHAL